MVRGYILTPHEREVLQRYLESDEKLNGFSVLLHYLKKNKDSIQKDLDLIDKALEAAARK